VLQDASRSQILLAFLLATAVSALNASAPAPPAPTLVDPASGAALAQPMTLGWSPLRDASGATVKTVRQSITVTN
jgi:hypothetical protein